MSKLTSGSNPERQQHRGEFRRVLLFLTWIASWFALPAGGLELLKFGPTGFVLTGMAAIVGPPALLIALGGGHSPPVTYRSPVPVALLAAIFGTVALVALARDASDTTWTVWVVPGLLFAAIAIAIGRANRIARDVVD